MQPMPPPPPGSGPLPGPPGMYPPGYYPPPPPPKASLLWLWILLGVGGVVVVIGILAAIAIPSFMDYAKKAKRTDAALRTEQLYKAIQVYYIERGELPRTPGGPMPADNTCCNGPNHKCAPDMAQWQVEPWQSLDFSVDEPTYFSFSYEPDPSGQSFTISARGDLDCDMNTAVYYQIVGQVQDGNLTKQVTVTSGTGD